MASELIVAFVLFLMIIMFGIRKKMDYIKKHNMFAQVGENCYFQSNILPAEPFLVYLHNNVAISAGVRLVTHSALNTVFNHEENTDTYLCRYGKVEIGNNVYIGADVILSLIHISEPTRP